MWQGNKVNIFEEAIKNRKPTKFSVASCHKTIKMFRFATCLEFQPMPSGPHPGHMLPNLSPHCRLISGVIWAMTGLSLLTNRSLCSFLFPCLPQAFELWLGFSAWKKKGGKKRNRWKQWCGIKVICWTAKVKLRKAEKGNFTFSAMREFSFTFFATNIPPPFSTSGPFRTFMTQPRKGWGKTWDEKKSIWTFPYLS